MEKFPAGMTFLQFTILGIHIGKKLKKTEIEIIKRNRKQPREIQICTIFLFINRYYFWEGIANDCDMSYKLNQHNSGFISPPVNITQLNKSNYKGEEIQNVPQ